MAPPTDGIHHVTTIAGDPQATVDCYTDVLGLRLVKRTVNFDDPTTYHLYFGDETGSPGTIYTVFPFGSGTGGRVGPGQATATAFAVPPGSLEYWAERLAGAGLEVDEPVVRFGEPVLGVHDEDGQPLELVATESPVEPWADGPVPVEHAIRGFHGVTLTPTDPAATGEVLERLGYERDASAGDRTRYRAGGDRAVVVDLVEPDEDAPRGRMGAGTVHHVAFRVPDDDAQFAHRDRLMESGQQVTGQKDRQYFRSVYFREPGGVLFELATDGPGFTADEAVTALGSALRLPDWLEEDRAMIESQLPPLGSDTTVGAD